ncbi:hypothetical protein NPIL_196531 [Nephila pilipes]|uniref:Uncharacterized protein n=1 Tax=Nephila pilipes TaxID=299642 RepID=A0A8X6NNG4_NEPPI|nr:hypothetical protein NPIL_196531 [Nephila pilipes]
MGSNKFHGKRCFVRKELVGRFFNQPRPVRLGHKIDCLPSKSIKTVNCAFCLQEANPIVHARHGDNSAADEIFKMDTY